MDDNLDEVKEREKRFIRDMKDMEDFNNYGFDGKKYFVKFITGGLFHGYEMCCDRNCDECPWGDDEEHCLLRE